MTTKRVLVSQDLARHELAHGDMAAIQCLRAGPYMFLGGQGGVTREGRVIGEDDPAAQTAQACENLGALVERAGAALSDVVKLVVYTTDRAQRGAVQAVLRRLFPEPGPCQTEYIVRDLGRGEKLLVMLDAWAVVDDDRTRKQLLRTADTSLGGGPADGQVAEGYRAGNLVYLAGQVGRPEASGGRSIDPATQARQAMDHLGNLMGLAGGSLRDVVRVVRGVTERSDRATTYPAIQRYWADRPPPGTGLVVKGLATEALKIQIDAWGFIETPDACARVVRTHDVTAAGMLGGIGRATQAVRAGNWVFLQGQVGWTLEGDLVALGDPAGQARQAMANIEALMELAGGSLTDIVRVVIYMTDRAVPDLAYPVIDQFWKGLWPCHTGVIVKGLARPEMLIEIDAYGFVDDAA
jgi:enamine deaminase RidA (YjgF/YER057c/UK114 family)